LSPNPGRAASSICPDLIYDRHRQAAITARQVVRQYRSHPIAYRWLAASLGQLGRTEEARDALQTLQTILAVFVRDVCEAAAEILQVSNTRRMLEGLRKAGWRE